MEVIALTNYRHVGGRLGAYIRANNPSTQQIQGLLADLLAGDKLLPTMREVVTMPAFAALQSQAGSGGGAIHRDALHQELAARYLPVVVDEVGQLVNGMLDLPVGQTASIAALSTDTNATQSSRTSSDNEAQPTRREVPSRSASADQNTKRYPELVAKTEHEIRVASKAVVGLMAAGLIAGLLTIFVSNRTVVTTGGGAKDPLSRTDGADARTSDIGALKTNPVAPIDDGFEKVRDAEATLGIGREHFRRYAFRGEDTRSCTSQDSRPACAYQRNAGINTISEAEAKLNSIPRESPAYLVAQDLLVRPCAGTNRDPRLGC